MSEEIKDFEKKINKFKERFEELTNEIQVAIVGYTDIITDCLNALFCQGHVLLEGVPGLGKTYLVRIISRVLNLSFGRIQCTPDLMPADILGTYIVSNDESGSRSFLFKKGPVFKHLLLVDEVNRATPKTQAALLEVMQERSVTAGDERMKLPEPFFVLATQNPIEMEGTYPLPEAQLDRFFFKVRVPFPDSDELVEISRRTTRFTEPDVNVVIEGHEIIEFQEILTYVPMADPLRTYAASLILATHPENEMASSEVNQYVAYGASPRGLQALTKGARVRCLLDGRTAVSINDIQSIAKQVLRHRIILNFEGEAEGFDIDTLIDDIIEKVPTPAGGLV